MLTDIRVLLLTHESPFPVRSGGQMYTANVITSLADSEGVKLSVVAIGGSELLGLSPQNVDWHLVAPKTSSGGAVRGLLGKYPRSTAATISNAYRKTVKDLLGNQAWDVVIIDYIGIGWILNDVRSAIDIDQTQIVYLSHNVESTLRKRIAEGYKSGTLWRWLAMRDAAKAASLEGAIVRASSVVTAETEEDAVEFSSIFGKRPIHIYTPGYDGHYAQTRSISIGDAPRSVALIGSRLATMKRLVLDDLLAAVAGECQRNGVKITVVGDAPSEYLKLRAQQYPDVDFHGYVADVTPMLADCRLGLITDHIGGGFKHRILTLVFNRVPIIATSAAMAGLPLKPGIDYIEVCGNAEVASAVISHVDDVELLERVQQNAYEACRKVFDWQVTTAAFVDMLVARLPESAT